MAACRSSASLPLRPELESIQTMLKQQLLNPAAESFVC
jgi:hypothetical protein